MNHTKSARRRFGGVLLILFVLFACSPEIVEEPFEPTESHAAYRDALSRLELDTAAIGEQWLAASRRALAAPVLVEAPYRELTFFDPAAPDAIGYRFDAERGRRITVTIETTLTRYFADVFRLPEGGDPVLVASRPAGGSTVEFEPRSDATYLFRLQPELLRGGRFDVSIVAEASLSFPVQGVGPEAVLSFYGDSRDAGLRMHEGIDIFAPRGTPILAASDSVVQRVGERDRGGNVVTLYDEERQLMLYYAHLDEQLVRQGQRVSAGDPIGTTGNTGNAITTPPHLHIGIYQGSWGRDVDPWNYFVDPPLTTPAPIVAPELEGRWIQIGGDLVLESVVPAPVARPRFVNFNPQLRERRADVPETVAEQDGAVQSVVAPAGTAVRVRAVTWRYARVETAEGSTGVVAVSELDSQLSPRLVRITDDRVARDPRTGDGLSLLEAGSSVTFLGSAGPETAVVSLPGGRVAIIDSL